MWQADGEQPLVEISNPTTDDTPRTKDLAGDEVSRRLSFLASLSDTQGWSTRGINAPVNNTNLTDEFAGDAINAQDVMEDSEVSNSIDNLLDKSERRVRQNAINQMNQAVQRQAQQQAAATLFQPLAATVQPASVGQATSLGQVVTAPTLATTANLPTYDYNSVIQPLATSPNLQTQTPQPMHNQRMQAYGQPQVAATPVAYTATQPDYQSNATVAVQPVQPQVNYQAQSVQYQQSNVLQVPVNQASVAPTPNPAPSVTMTSKPAIMDNDNAYHQPTLDASTGDEPTIDIKLH